MTSNGQQPVLFISHGGGPSFFLDAKTHPMFKGMDKNSHAADFLRNLVKNTGIKTPTAILVFSAHWVEGSCRVTSSSKTSLYYDYGGFPPETYKLEWPGPGAPKVAKKVIGLLSKNGIKCTENTTRGLDHGVFIPLKLVFPEANIPVLQVSLLKNMDIVEHMKLGEALTEIRKEDVLVIGSGFGTHAGMKSGTALPWALKFQQLLHDVVTNLNYTPEERKNKLISITKEDCYAEAHSPPDHFLPFPMCCAISGYKPGKILISEFVSGSLLFENYLFQ